MAADSLVAISAVLVGSGRQQNSVVASFFIGGAGEATGLGYCWRGQQGTQPANWQPGWVLLGDIYP